MLFYLILIISGWFGRKKTSKVKRLQIPHLGINITREIGAI